MKISQPLELKDKDKVIDNLSKLDFIVIERVKDEAIIKRKLNGRFIKLKIMFNADWIGQIIRDKKNGKYYFLNESGTLKDVFKLDDWNRIKLFMGCLE